jgi:Pyridoxamine 5'-phosphate oxidase
MIHPAISPCARSWRTSKEHASDFIGRSPFVIVPTADSEGWSDASPRGDAPGFVRVVDEQRLQPPDRPGNNRLDSLQNLVANPRIGLLFLVPRRLETLRAVCGSRSIGPRCRGLQPLPRRSVTRSRVYRRRPSRWHWKRPTATASIESVAAVGGGRGPPAARWRQRSSDLRGRASPGGPRPRT